MTYIKYQRKYIMSRILYHIIGFVCIICVWVSFSGCPKPDLQVSALSHHFAGDTYTGIVETEWSFKLWNAGEKNSILYYKVEPLRNWINVNPTSGKLGAGDPAVDIWVQINRDGTPKAVPNFATGYIKVSGGGKEKVITVTTVPNFYTEVFGGLYNRPFDLSNTTLVFIPDSNSLHFYKQGIKKNIQQFPQQPANTGQPVYFAVQDPVYIKSTIAPIPFYGVEYTDIYVSSKGYISFGANGLEPITVGKHFAYPQISLLPVDVFKAEEGSVVYLILPQKLVITWINIPLAQNPTMGDDGKPFKNNIQVELFYDGKIQITYLSTDPKMFNAVVGLSCGGGDGTNPPVRDFVISDLSSAPEI